MAECLSSETNAETPPTPEDLAMRALDVSTRFAFGTYTTQPLPEYIRARISPDEYPAGTQAECVVGALPNATSCGDADSRQIVLGRLTLPDGTVSYLYDNGCTWSSGESMGQGTSIRRWNPRGNTLTVRYYLPDGRQSGQDVITDTDDIRRVTRELSLAFPEEVPERSRIARLLSGIIM